MTNLFIDSNIWLSLYNFTNDDLEQFSKLKNLIDRSIKLYIPVQVRDEVARNREHKLKQTFTNFCVKSLSYPAFCMKYDEYESFHKEYNDIYSKFESWKIKIDNDVKNRTLPADEIIANFFEANKLIPCEGFVNLAYTRYRIGNPPGKENSFGDAIIWECLLQYVPDGEDLCFISSDNDFSSVLNKDELNPFLQEEWQEKKKSKIIFYKNLVPFLSEHIKDIELKSEQEKQKLVFNLQNSINYRHTHEYIDKLNKYHDWDDDQIEKICLAAINNRQVGDLLNGDDVHDFFLKLLSSKANFNNSNEAVKKLYDVMLNNKYEN